MIMKQVILWTFYSFELCQVFTYFFRKCKDYYVSQFFCHHLSVFDVTVSILQVTGNAN